MSQIKPVVQIQRVRVVGLGGIGGCLVPPLLRFIYFSLGHCEIHLIDGDSYEEKNLARQRFQKLGNKAEVTAELHRPEYPGLTIISHSDYVYEDNVIRYIRDGDVVFCCVDNHSTRKLLSDRGEELNNIVIISGGNELINGSIQVYQRFNGTDYTLTLDDPEHYPEIANSIDQNPAHAGCDVALVSAPQLLFMNNMVAALMLNAFYVYVMKGKVRYDSVYCDMITNDTRPIFISNPLPSLIGHRKES